MFFGGRNSPSSKLAVHESSFIRSRYQRANPVLSPVERGERSCRKDAGRSPLALQEKESAAQAVHLVLDRRQVPGVA